MTRLLFSPQRLTIEKRKTTASSIRTFIYLMRKYLCIYLFVCAYLFSPEKFAANFANQTLKETGEMGGRAEDIESQD